MEGYVRCNECGINVSWEALERAFTAIKELHDKEHIRILSTRSITIKGEDK